jgi:hypothetical protein
MRMIEFQERIATARRLGLTLSRFDITSADICELQGELMEMAAMSTPVYDGSATKVQEAKPPGWAMTVLGVDVCIASATAEVYE